MTLLENDFYLGNKKSKTVLIEYYSPSCTSCNYYHKYIFSKIKARYIDSNKILYIMREIITDQKSLDFTFLARGQHCYSGYLILLGLLSEHKKIFKNYPFNKSLDSEVKKKYNLRELDEISKKEILQIKKTIKNNTKLLLSEDSIDSVPVLILNGEILNIEDIQKLFQKIDVKIKLIEKN